MVVIRFCSSCGAKVDDGDAFCSFCGTPLHLPKAQSIEPKSFLDRLKECELHPDAGDFNWLSLVDDISTIDSSGKFVISGNVEDMDELHKQMLEIIDQAMSDPACKEEERIELFRYVCELGSQLMLESANQLTGCIDTMNKAFEYFLNRKYGDDLIKALKGLNQDYGDLYTIDEGYRYFWSRSAKYAVELKLAFPNDFVLANELCQLSLKNLSDSYLKFLSEYLVHVQAFRLVKGIMMEVHAYALSTSVVSDFWNGFCKLVRGLRPRTFESIDLSVWSEVEKSTLEWLTDALDREEDAANFSEEREGKNLALADEIDEAYLGHLLATNRYFKLEYDRVAEEVDEAEQKYERLKQSLDVESSCLNEMNSAIAEADLLVDRDESEIARLRKKVFGKEKARLKAVELEREVSEAFEKRRKLIEDRDSLSSRVNELTDKVEDAKRVLNDAKANIARLIDES